jgi:hypothetical protein
MKNCSHSACHCAVEPGKAILEDGLMFCSQFCANARESSDACQCGHSSCESDLVDQKRSSHQRDLFASLP